MIHFLWFITFCIVYLAIGSFAAGLMFGNDSNPPDPWAAAVVIFAWPLVAVLAFCAAGFGFGAWIGKSCGGGS